MINRANKDATFINVAGFFWSGSSAVVDLLKEFKDFYECDAEIRFIKDPRGLCDLENALVDHWEMINSAAAIADYRNMIKKFCRGGKHFYSPAGLGYRWRINDHFLEITDEYLDRLTKYKYMGEYYHFKFQKNYFKYILDRYRAAIEIYSKGKLKTANRSLELLHFSNPTREEFYAATKDYIQALFTPHIEGKSNPYIILDQAVSPNNPDVVNKYFHNSKLIIVDRDPRDTFVNLYTNGCQFNDENNSELFGHNYAIRQRALRAGLKESANILLIRFEELILNYDETVALIADFIGVPLSSHISPKKFLKPELSAKNVGLWKKHYKDYNKSFEIIKEELPDLCFNN